MEEREKLWICVTTLSSETLADRYGIGAAVAFNMPNGIRRRYVDRLNSKQRKAINLLRIADMGTVIHGMGCKCLHPYSDQPKVLYILTC